MTMRCHAYYINFIVCRTLACRTDRIAAADTVVKGVTIPKGMVINVPIYALHHDPEYWSEPEKFYPER